MMRWLCRRVITSLLPFISSPQHRAWQALSVPVVQLCISLKV